MRTAVLLLFLVLISACNTMRSPVEISPLSTPAQYAELAGQRVTFTGIVSDSRIPQVRGIDVHELEQLRGRAVRVTGVLRQSVVTEAQLAEMEAQMGGQFATRGAGTFYRLEDVSWQVLE